jgi:hypothetical protein
MSADARRTPQVAKQTAECYLELALDIATLLLLWHTRGRGADSRGLTHRGLR